MEKIVPSRSLHVRNLSPEAVRIKATGIISFEEATWIEEVIFYSLDSARVVQWLDRWLINPIPQQVAACRLPWRSLTPRYHPEIRSRGAQRSIIREPTFLV